jgi:23S rRNA (adenine2503-C2)-methyltransferase
MALISLGEPKKPALTDLLGKSREELREFAVETGQPKYRGEQLYHALYAERLSDLSAISNLPATWCEHIASIAEISLPRIVRRFQSTDGSVRYLLEINSGGAPSAQIETVFMPDPRKDGNRQTICISTQAGCAVDCHFCLTAQLGLQRNLSAGEIVGQILVALNDQRENLLPQTNVVLMGQGEPLLNYDPVMAALRIMLDPHGLALGPRHVTLSTAGIVPGIERLAGETVRPRLAISLNASNDAQRDAIMPINRKYPLAVLLDACRRYPLRSWEHVNFEYVLLGGVNDSPEDARRVAKLLAGIRAKINLIPWNPGALPYHAPAKETVDAFRNLLDSKDIPVFIRYSRGQDIMAACGQLALLEASA